MEMHKVEYEIQLTGSKIFDVVMFNTAKKVCDEYPGLELEYHKSYIRIFGELNDYWFDRYRKEVYPDTEGN